MEQIYNSLKSLICPILIEKASRIVDEKEKNISNASESIIAGLLGVLESKGDNPQIRNILNEASNLNILADSINICQERPTEEQRKISDDFLQQLLGDKAADFSNSIAAHANISKVATNRLVYMIAPLVAGYLGDQLQIDNRNLPQLLRQIKMENKSFASYIPSSLLQTFGLAPFMNENKGPVMNNTPVEKKNSSNWITWLMILALLLLGFLWWRSCSDSTLLDRSEMSAVRDTITDVRSTPVTPTANVRNETRDTIHLMLPDQQMITVYKGGIEEEMMKYLNSDTYKNATENDLKEKWFEFDNITFEFDSPTRLMDHSGTQLNNIIAILKSYPDARVRIAGFADKKGSKDINMEISKERAKTIEKLFNNGGVGKQVVTTEGFGEEHAKRSASAPDSLRAKDRDIALRFVK